VVYQCPWNDYLCMPEAMRDRRVINKSSTAHSAAFIRGRPFCDTEFSPLFSEPPCVFFEKPRSDPLDTIAASMLHSSSLISSSEDNRRFSS
jgi:hypothetical protein